MTEPSSVHHLAIIMDGNRRWARAQGLPSIEGHRVGYEKFKMVGDWCLVRGIKILTFFAFSTENWKRTQEEVGYLMDLLEKSLRDERTFFMERGIRVRILGRREGLRPSIVRAIVEIEEMTASFDRMTLAICLNYGGRPELVDAVRQIVKEGIPVEMIDEQAISKRLYWSDMPDPDLILRTSGEERLSGFLLWESAYSEFFFTKTHWPAFSEQDLDAALGEYTSRQRRHGV